MRKVLFILTIVFCFLTTSCDPSLCYFSAENYPSKIVSIQLGVYANNDCKYVDVRKGAILKFDRTKLDIIEELEYEKNEAFLKDFGKIGFWNLDSSINEPAGYCLLLNLENNNYIVVSCTRIESINYGMFAEFDSNDQFCHHIASFDGISQFENLLVDYFETYTKDVE